MSISEKVHQVLLYEKGVEMEAPEQLKAVAKETVEVLDQVSNKAKEKVTQSGQAATHAQLANVNTFTDTNAVSRMTNIASSIQTGYSALQHEPAIARVIYLDGEEEKTLYISRKSTLPVDGNYELASYDSPMGRLASLNVGDEVTVRRGETPHVLEVIKTLTIKPSKSENGWDSSFSVYTSEDEEVSTISPSLRRLFQQDTDLSDTSFLDQLLSGSDSSADYEKGLKHQVRSAMSLRDQPILDKFQSEIFRLPLDSKLVILGPPGTGKTTTLIKRLGQKLNIESLELPEQLKIKNSQAGEAGHKVSWVMFTPTDLLKHFLKEAFAKEQVPASSEQIKTWDNYSNDLGRNVLSILQSTGSSGFVKRNVQHLNDDAYSKLPSFCDSFLCYHKEAMIKELLSSIAQLEDINSPQLKGLVENIKSIRQSLEQSSLIEFYRNLEKYQDEINSLIALAKEESEKGLREALAYQVNTNREFIAELVAVIDNWKKRKSIDAVEDDDEDEEDEENLTTPQQRAFSEYKRAINGLARAKYQKRTPSSNTLSAAIIKWLDERLPEPEKLIKLGSLAIRMRELRKFKNAELRYLKAISKNYRAFRKTEEHFKRWFESSPLKPNQIEQAELDVLVLANLRVSKELLAQRFVQQKMDGAAFSKLSIVNENFKNQIFVDEATDFTPIQLACMEALAEPSIGSFFACGDFNQRLTEHGSKSTTDLNWISSKIVTETITTVYRQSELLNTFATSLLKEVGGDIEYSGKLPDSYNHKGVMPVLLENTDETSQIVSWLKDRIGEVENQVEELPSIAVLVNNEEEVKPLADALNEELEDLNIRAVACRDGQSLGEGNDVRVFDIQHIKGLEFEAVFFVGVDVLASSKPNLIDKFLYVGATRAATYLGITCEAKAPLLIDKLRSSFSDSWA